MPRPVLGQAGVALLLTSLLACGTSDQTPAERPELVFAETDSATRLSAIVGYSDAEGVREIIPGPSRLPRPAYGDVLVRPSTGELLYYSDEQGRAGLVLLDAATGRFRYLELPGVPLNWSPSGGLLVVHDGSSQMVVTPSGAVRDTVCHGDLYTCGVHTWTPGGDAVVGSRSTAGSPADLWLVPLTGAPPVNLTQTPAVSEIGPSYSPDGRHLAYRRQFDLLVSNADGSGARTLASDVFLADSPWSPDGSRLAIAALDDAKNGYGIAIVPVDGAAQIITPPGEQATVFPQLSWSPDGRRLAYTVYPGSGSGIAVILITVDGTGRRQLSTPGSAAVLPAWLPGTQ
jgi:dipeptidyl aminopeptidase/acylaminoacyl peptidase